MRTENGKANHSFILPFKLFVAEILISSLFIEITETDWQSGIYFSSVGGLEQEANNSAEDGEHVKVTMKVGKIEDYTERRSSDEDKKAQKEAQKAIKEQAKENDKVVSCWMRPKRKSHHRFK